MPKERFHILLAEEAFRLIASPGRRDASTGQDHLLASILPDMFFYDLPTFKLGSYGRSLHRFEGRGAVEFCLEWLRQDGDHLEMAQKHWMFGFAGHFLADGLLHPLINRNCHRFGKDLKLTSTACHHWLESELEAYWLAAIGPADGFLGLLAKLASQPEKVTAILGFLRRFLIRAGLSPMPSEAAMRRCLGWQARLLRLFAHPRWTRIRPWLMRFPPTQYFGVLLAPPKTSRQLSVTDEKRGYEACSASLSPLYRLKPPRQGPPPGPSHGGKSLPPEIGEMFKADFMARTISHLSSHLLELAERF